MSPRSWDADRGPAQFCPSSWSFCRYWSLDGCQLSPTLAPQRWVSCTMSPSSSVLWDEATSQPPASRTMTTSLWFPEYHWCLSWPFCCQFRLPSSARSYSESTPWTNSITQCSGSTISSCGRCLLAAARTGRPLSSNYGTCQSPSGLRTARQAWGHLNLLAISQEYFDQFCPWCNDDSAGRACFLSVVAIRGPWAL